MTADALQVEQVRRLYRSPVAVAVNLLNAPITAAVLWDRSLSVPLGVWGVAFFVVIPLRLWQRHAFFRQPRKPEEIGRWAIYYVVGIGVTGCLWGALGCFAFAAADAKSQAFVAFVLGGMGAGAVAATSVYLPAVIAFIVPAIAPPALVLMAQGAAVPMAMGALGLAFFAAMVLIGRSFNRSLAEGYRLQLENAALIERLTAARDEAEAASEAKSRFLATMSHELRTPLNAIIGFSEMMQHELRGPIGAYRDYASHIRDSGVHLLSLINNILDLSKAQAGRIELFEDRVDLNPILESSLDLVRLQAAQAGIELSLSVEEGLGPLHVDDGKLRQIVINLLSNAVKFTPRGGVIRVGAARGEEGDLLVTVADTGIGMAPSDIPRAMQPFQQLGSPVSGNFAGTGLGLPLARQLAELHGGSLELSSEIGQGTTATLRIPAHRLSA